MLTVPRIFAGLAVAVLAMGALMAPAAAKGHHGHRHGHGQSHHASARHGHSHHSTATHSSEPCPALKQLAEQTSDPAALRRYHACLARQSGY